MTDVLEQIRGRRDVTIAQMAMALDACGEADLETKRQLLGVASRGLHDPEIAARWMKIAAAEMDTELRAILLGRLAGLDVRQVSEPTALVKLLIDAIGLEPVRVLAIGALARLVRGNEQLAVVLAARYREQLHRDVQRRLLFTLLQVEDPPPPVKALLLEVVDACDADVKPLVVDRLLRADALADARLARLLDRAEPEPVRLMVFDFLVDRSRVLDEAVCAAIETDPSAACRIAALRAMATRGLSSPRTVTAILGALRHDPDPEVRRTAAAAFEQALDPTPAAIDALLEILASEKTTELAEILVGMLAPHVAHSPAVSSALANLFARNIDADLAVLVCRTLAPLVITDAQWLERFVQGFAATRHDRVRAAILDALARVADPDARLVSLYRQALDSPAPEIRAWGVRGLALVPADESRGQTIAAGASALLDRTIDVRLRLDLARKIAVIPDKSPALIAALARVSEQADGELRDVCRRACDRAASEQGAEAVDWEAWYRRVDVEHDVAGIFPDIFFHYDANPDAARRILRAALAPDLSEPLYRHRVGESQILDFLAAKQAIDDELSRYCVNVILTREGNPDSHLALLKSNLAFPALRESLWQILERRAGASPILMRELLVLAHGDEDQIARLLRERLFAQQSPARAAPYLALLAGNLAWPPAAAVLRDVPRQPHLLDARTRGMVADAMRTLGVTVADQPPPGPGLADE